ncbi:hypothetical protein [Pedobacter lusitanus]|uniref:hypothetical protein n=1 Tax=Pedobacter lusitanus TaxID=1503925 RepID=UPI00069810F4|nr:hypothetical protein [Pedobacter lusitanus]
MKSIIKLTLFSSLILLFFIQKASAQGETVMTPSNGSVGSLENNLLFYADTKYKVSQSGSTALNLAVLFDGNFQPSYSEPINPADPYVILIENLPVIHVQRAAWIGWSTRYYPPTKFKIEVYNAYQGAGNWVTIADVDNYQQYSFMTPLSSVAPGKIRLTFYNTSGVENRLGLSEIFFIHPEATSAYDNLLVRYSPTGNVGLGVDNPTDKLAVRGTIRANEIKVMPDVWPDYVFSKGYKPMSLPELEKFIQTNQHLPEVPSAKEVETNGIALGNMNKVLLQKIEELTLHLIEKDKQIEIMKNDLEIWKKELLKLKTKVN